jgi:endoglucanase
MLLHCRSAYFRAAVAAFLLSVVLANPPLTHGQCAYVRVNQIGYEAGNAPFRAYLMSTAPESGAVFKVVNSKGQTAYSRGVGALLGIWSNSHKLSYQVYALDFSVAQHDMYTISVSGPVPAVSPSFAVDEPQVLYPGLLLNTLFFYETERDGPNYLHNALRSAPGHLKDKSAQVYETPPLDSNDFIDNKPPIKPLVPVNSPNINVDGGWWDAGDYMKYVETVSYTTALMEVGIRDFPNQMGANAPVNPRVPPGSISYAGNSGAGAPASSDFTNEARFGIEWLAKMWDGKTKTLYYQVDNSQDWDYYGEGDPASSAPDCGGNYSSPYCLITEYDIWTLPQAADDYEEGGDPQPCDQYTAYFICDRPVFPAGAAGAPISPNLAGRLAADFALCYQLNHATDAAFANQCLKNAEEIFALADTSYPDPAPSVGSGNCPTCLVTIMPFDGYPENIWDDDMELGATELYFALQFANESGDLPAGLLDTNPNNYLRQAAQYAKNYITNIYDPGFSDTLNLYDVSGLAHFELYRALEMAGAPSDLAVSKSSIRAQFLKQVGDAISQAQTDAWGYGSQWNYGDTTSHGAGLSVMASEAYYLTGSQVYDTYAQRWLANILGVNAWGSSFIVGDGSTFPNCIQHQVANLAGALNGTSGGTPILWGASTEGPAGYSSTGFLDGMSRCPAGGVDTFKIFNGNNGKFDASQAAVYKDNVQSFSTTEPGIDLTATSFLMWPWRLAGHPSF